jgi:hypothetical protein
MKKGLNHAGKSNPRAESEFAEAISQMAILHTQASSGEFH